MEQYNLAFDVGGTSIKYARVDQNYHLSQQGSVPTRHNQNQSILTTLVDLTKQFMTSTPITGIGVSTAGIVGQDGAIQYAGPTIKDYQGTPIKQTLTTISKLPVAVVNDVDAALLGELLAGAAQGAEKAYCVALGTGIGGAFAINGNLYSGAHGFANAIGYTTYSPSTKTYYEQRAATLCLEATLKPYQLSVKDAFEQAKQHIEPYQTIIEDWFKEVARGLANVILLLDPDVLIIGGAVAQQGDYLVSHLNAALKMYVPSGLNQTVLKPGELANDAQLIGAISALI